MKIRHFFYFLFASLVFVACKEDDPVEPTPEITGLDFTITTYDDQPLAVGVTPTATGAESFKIYFDSVGDPDTFQETSGALVTHTYVTEATTTFTIKVVASNSNGAADVELTKDHTATVVPPTVLADFESSNPPFFSDDLTVVADGAGGNSTAVGKQSQLDGGLYDSFTITNAKYVDLTEKAVISFDFWQETAATPKLAIKMEGVVETGLYDVQVEVTAEAVAGWQTVSFDFENDRANSYPNNEEPLSDLGTYSKIIGFIGIGEEVAGTFYLDNFTGGEFGEDLPDADSDGTPDALDFCKTVVGDSTLYGCPMPAAAAADPTKDASEVGNFYSDAYTELELVTVQTSWSVNAQGREFEVATGNDALLYAITAVNGYGGIEVKTPFFDASAYNMVHFDVYSVDKDDIAFKFEQEADNAGTKVIDVTAGEWTSVDIPTSQFVPQDPGAMDAIVVGVVSSDTVGTVYFDNIYFWNDPSLEPPTVLTLTCDVSALSTAPTSVRITGPWWSWDPAGGPVAVDNGDGTWSVPFNDVTAEDPIGGNMEYLWVVDGVQEVLWDNAANAECATRIDSGNLVTDYYSYGNRVYLVGGNLDVQDVYDSCQ
jgi:hypothetical protein